MSVSCTKFQEYHLEVAEALTAIGKIQLSARPSSRTAPRNSSIMASLSRAYDCEPARLLFLQAATRLRTRSLGRSLEDIAFMATCSSPPWSSMRLSSESASVLVSGRWFVRGATASITGATAMG